MTENALLSLDCECLCVWCGVRTLWMLPDGEDCLLPFRAINTSAAFISSKVSGQGRREGEGRAGEESGGRADAGRGDLLVSEGVRHCCKTGHWSPAARNMRRPTLRDSGRYTTRHAREGGRQALPYPSRPHAVAQPPELAAALLPPSLFRVVSVWNGQPVCSLVRLPFNTNKCANERMCAAAADRIGQLFCVP